MLRQLVDDHATALSGSATFDSVGEVEHLAPLTKDSQFARTEIQLAGSKIAISWDDKHVIVAAAKGHEEKLKEIAANVLSNAGHSVVSLDNGHAEPKGADYMSWTRPGGFSDTAVITFQRQNNTLKTEDMFNALVDEVKQQAAEFPVVDVSARSASHHLRG